MRVAIRSPSSRNRDQIRQTLAVDPTIEVVSERLGAPDIVLVDAGYFQGDGSQPPRLPNGPKVIVVFAPSDSEELAQFLASGARGYYCVGEPQDQLIEVVHQVAAGEVRAEPQVMNLLLHHYRRLLHLTDSY